MFSSVSVILFRGRGGGGVHPVQAGPVHFLCGREGVEYILSRSCPGRSSLGEGVGYPNKFALPLTRSGLEGREGTLTK